MRGRRQRQRTALLVLVAVLAAGSAAVVDAADLLRRAELASVDARFEVRGTQAPPRDVVIVALDDRSLDALNVNPPIPRRFHAQVIDRLRRAGARVVGYDFEFIGPTTVRDDDALLGALRRRPGVILATTRIARDGTFETLGGAENLRYARAVAASVNYTARNARYGTIRRISAAELGLPTFAVAAARQAGARVDPADLDGDGAWIDVPGPAATVRTHSLVDVVRGRVPDAAFRGRVVLVGATSPVLQDVSTTAAGTGVPGVEVNAAAVDTLMRDVPLRDAGGGITGLWLILLAALTPLAAIALTGLRWLPVPALVTASGAVIAQLAFGAGRILPVAAAALGLLMGALGTLAVAYATDVRDRRRLRRAFSRYVPPAVVDEVVAQAGEDLRLGGVRREGTVLFCDLRGFTAVAERLEPEAVVELLNAYLSQMTEAILDHGGTVVSFMGDGIMAVWGAPLVQEDHADRALAAAREMAGPRLDAFNAAAALAAPLRLGVGICSGPVLSGNVGSARRVEYAAVGDTTNTAARLEQLTKTAGALVLIAASTRSALRDPAAHEGLREVGEFPLRGREEPVHCWTFA